MRILVVSDIHANAPALAAIREPYDVCLCIGDYVDYGPQPAICVQWALDHVDHAVRGNHDHGVAQGVEVTGDYGYRYLTRITRPLMWPALDKPQREYLLRLPLTRRVTIGSKRFLLVHGTPRDPLDEYVMRDPEAWARRVADADADIVCVGHTHMQFNLEVEHESGKTVVLNPGTVGMPRDGDPRVAYAMIEDGRIHLRRIDYDVDETIRLTEALPIPDDAKALLRHAYTHGRLPRP